MQTIYKICAQTLGRNDKKTLLIIQVLGRTEQLVRTAAQIIADKTMLSGFHPEDACMIGYIHATEQDTHATKNSLS